MCLMSLNVVSIRNLKVEPLWKANGESAVREIYSPVRDRDVHCCVQKVLSLGPFKYESVTDLIYYIRGNMK